MENKKDIEPGHIQFKWKLPNMILIAGDGRNVGKTTFARDIIRHLSEKAEITGIKTSPHFHKLSEDLDIIHWNSDYVVAEEKGRSRKDSSLLLQAGAKRVFFIMAKQEYLEEAFSLISGMLDHHIIIAESGGLNELIEPAVFFFVRNKQESVKKEQYLKFNPYMVTNSDQGFDFEVSKLDVRNEHITINID